MLSVRALEAFLGEAKICKQDGEPKKSPRLSLLS